MPGQLPIGTHLQRRQGRADQLRCAPFFRSNLNVIPRRSAHELPALLRRHHLHRGAGARGE